MSDSSQRGSPPDGAMLESMQQQQQQTSVPQAMTPSGT